MYLSVTELAKKLGVTGTRIRTLIRQGRIKGAFKVGKMWVINVLKKTMHKNNRHPLSVKKMLSMT
jgi:excisionase family DNA binding protein